MPLNGPVVLAGHFDPATIARQLPMHLGEKIAGLRRPPAVPIHSLAQALTSRNIRTTLLGGVRGSERLYLEGDPLSVAIYSKRGGWPFLLSGLRRERLALLEFLREIEPSIVHAHWTMEAGRAVSEWRGPKVLTVHDTAWEYARLGWTFQPVSMAFTARWLANTHQTLKGFRHIIAVSPYVETYLRLRHRFRGEIRVIPNAIPPLPFDLTVPDRTPKTGRMTFGCYGGPGRLKNVGLAIAAFQAMERGLSGARLLVFGAGWKTVSTTEKSRIEFRGAVPHASFLRALVEEVDVWVHPARVEAHPLSICEAIQAGCPVIAGQASGGVAWTLDYGRAGFLVDVESRDEMGRAMRETILNLRQAREKVVYGQQFMQENLNPARIADLHLDYYREIVGSDEQQR